MIPLDLNQLEQAATALLMADRRERGVGRGGGKDHGLEYPWLSETQLKWRQRREMSASYRIGDLDNDLLDWLCYRLPHATIFATERGAYCSVEGCERPHEAKGKCHTHYTADLRKRLEDNPHRLCDREGCERPHHSGGLCHAHYQSFRYHLRVSDPEAPRCAQEGCEGVVRAKGLCGSHYNKTLYRRPCEVEGCENPLQARGMCWKHYTRWRRARRRQEGIIKDRG